MIAEMLLANGGPARCAMKDEQAAQVGIGKPEGMTGRGAPVRNAYAAMRAAYGRVIGIAKIPVAQKVRKAIHGFRNIRLCCGSGLGFGGKRALEALPQAVGDLNSNNVAVGISDVVDFFFHGDLCVQRRETR